MSFKRVHVLGSSGLFLLNILGCSGQPAGDAAAARDSSEPSERVDSSPVGARSAAPGGAASNCRNDDGSFNLAGIKWQNKLEKPPVYEPVETDARGIQHYEVTVKAHDAQMLPPCLPKTPVFAYGGRVIRGGVILPPDELYSPGPTFEMTRGTKASVKWINAIRGEHVLNLDSAAHGIPNAQTDVPYVTHLHGLEVASTSDGAPEAWFTSSGAHGPKYESNIYEYPNSQPATALWYHDHTLGMTRLNVYAGLAGMYIIREPNKAEPNGFVPPDEAHEMPLVIQDRSFGPDGKLVYAFNGEMNVVNGKVWPDMAVEPTRYRFRVLNGANNRSYNLALPELGLKNGPKITVIGSDGGYLAAPVEVTSLPLAPGERADILIDFSEVQAGQSLVLNDTLGGEVVRFTVDPPPGKLPDLPKVPATLVTLPDLKADAPTRTLTLNTSDEGVYLLNGQAWHGELSEKPQVGATEDWDLVNLSYEDHPIHVHLVQFRIISRQELNVTDYQAEWTRHNPERLPLKSPTTPVVIGPEYLTGVSNAPAPAEAGWKDTVLVPANTVTRIRIRWAPQDAATSTRGENPFEFDPTLGPGYVWHCHMLDHEDLDMMRPFQMTN
jgi:spore coat protein A, manganese oxidase